MAGEKVLIVDDELDVLELCKRILEGKGYRVRTASSGYEAIDIAKYEDFDLLLTDNQMPGITGLEIAKTLKQTDPNVICVTMTGFSTIDIVIEALKIDIDEFVMKPFTPNELGMAISKALEKQRLRRENFRLRSLIPLFELNKTFIGTREVNQLLRRVLEISKQETKADLIWLYTFEGNKIIPHVYSDDTTIYSQSQQQTSYQLAKSLQQQRQQFVITQKHAEADQLTLLEQLEGQSVIATPLRSQETNLGALVLVRQANDFAPSDSEFLSVMCGQAGIALENARLFTEKEEAYEELKKLDHMKSQFINIAAHELRTPLTILIGYTTILKDIADETQQDFVAPVMRNAMRLRTLIDDMLNLQYLESGVPALAREPLHLHQAIQAIIQDFDRQMEEKNLSIEVEIPDEFPVMIADPQKFDLIMVNLFNNAVEFNRQGGKIFFKAEYNDTTATLSVSDTGIGIPKEQLKHIFDRFFQVEDSLTREHGGIGLGLAIVRGMVEVCGGKISVESKEGEGTTFTFTLPLDNSNVEKSQLKI